jgi:hypothetical protein
MVIPFTCGCRQVACRGQKMTGRAPSCANRFSISHTSCCASRCRIRQIAGRPACRLRDCNSPCSYALPYRHSSHVRPDEGQETRPMRRSGAGRSQPRSNLIAACLERRKNRLRQLGNLRNLRSHLLHRITMLRIGPANLEHPRPCPPLQAYGRCNRYSFNTGGATRSFRRGV